MAKRDKEELYREGVKVIYVSEEINELLKLKDLCDRILHCDENTAKKHFIYQKGFPYVMMGKQRRYPRKQVEEWIERNTHYY